MVLLFVMPICALPHEIGLLPRSLLHAERSTKSGAAQGPPHDTHHRRRQSPGPALHLRRRRRHQQPPCKRRVVKRLGQWPSQPLKLGPAHVIARRRRRYPAALGNRPNAQSRGVVQPQSLSYLAHGQPPVRHRAPSPKTGKSPTVGGLSRVAQFRGSDPPDRSGQYPGTDPSATGITVHFAPESVSSLRRNPHTLVRLRWPGLYRHQAALGNIRAALLAETLQLRP